MQPYTAKRFIFLSYRQIAIFFRSVNGMINVIDSARGGGERNKHL